MGSQNRSKAGSKTGLFKTQLKIVETANKNGVENEVESCRKYDQKVEMASKNIENSTENGTIQNKD